MPVRIELDLPDGALSSLRTSPEGFVREMRLAAAVKWYEIHLLSQSKAAELAGVTRQEFVEALARFRVSPCQTAPEEMAGEVDRPLGWAFPCAARSP